MKINCSEFAAVYEADLGPKALLDVREASEVSEGAIKNSLNIPGDQLVQRQNEIPQNKNIYIHCRSGKRAQAAYHILEKLGFKNIFYIAEGGYEDLKLCKCLQQGVKQ